MLAHDYLQWTTEVAHWNSTFEPLTKLLSSCMGSYRAYLTGVVMQRGSIVFLSLTYTWQPEALPLQHRFIGYCYAKDSIVFLNLKYPWQPEAHLLTGTTDVINLASVLAGKKAGNKQWILLFSKSKMAAKNFSQSGVELKLQDGRPLRNNSFYCFSNPRWRYLFSANQKPN